MSKKQVKKAKKESTQATSSKEEKELINESVEFLKDLQRQISAELEERSDSFYYSSEDSCTQSYQLHEIDLASVDSETQPLMKSESAIKVKRKQILTNISKTIKQEALKLKQLIDEGDDGMLAQEVDYEDEYIIIERNMLSIEEEEEEKKSKRELTYNELKQLESFERCQKEFCLLFFDQEPVFQSKYEQLYGSLAAQKEQTKQNWLDLMLSIHERFFRQLEDNQMRFHFMRTFEFLITKLVRSFKHNDVNQYIQKWVYTLPKKLFAFVFNYGYELIYKYHRVYLGYSNDIFRFNQGIIPLEIKEFKRDSGSYLLREVLTTIQDKFTHTRQYWNYNQTLLKINDSRLKKLTHWYDRGEERISYIHPFESAQLAVNNCLEEDFYNSNGEELQKFYGEMDEAYKKYIELISTRQLLLDGGSDDDQKKQQQQQQLIKQQEGEIEVLWSQRASEVYSLFPLRKESEDVAIKLSCLQQAVVDKLVNATINQFNLVCLNGTVIEREGIYKFSQKDLNKLQMKLHYLPQLENLNKKRKHACLGNNSELTDEKDDDGNNREAQVEEYIMKRRTELQQCKRKAFNDYYTLLQEVYKFLYYDISLCHLLRQYSPQHEGSQQYIFRILPKLMQDYFFNKREIPYEYNLLSKAYSKYVELSAEKQEEIKGLGVYSKLQILEGWYANELKNLCCPSHVTTLLQSDSVSKMKWIQNHEEEYYKLNKQEQNKRHKSQLEIQQRLQLDEDDINTLQRYQLTDSEMIYKKPLLAQFKEYINHDRHTIHILNQCQYQFGQISPIFEKELMKYRSFRQELTQISRLQRQYGNGTTKLPSKKLYHTGESRKRQQNKLILRIDRLETKLHDAHHQSRNVQPPYSFEKIELKPSNDNYIQEVMLKNRGFYDSCTFTSPSSVRKEIECLNGQIEKYTNRIRSRNKLIKGLGIILMQHDIDRDSYDDIIELTPAQLKGWFNGTYTPVKPPKRIMSQEDEEIESDITYFEKCNSKCETKVSLLERQRKELMCIYIQELRKESIARQQLQRISESNALLAVFQGLDIEGNKLIPRSRISTFQEEPLIPKNIQAHYFGSKKYFCGLNINEFDGPPPIYVRERIQQQQQPKPATRSQQMQHDYQIGDFEINIDDITVGPLD